MHSHGNGLRNPRISCGVLPAGTGRLLRRQRVYKENHVKPVHVSVAVEVDGAERRGGVAEGGVHESGDVQLA